MIKKIHPFRLEEEPRSPLVVPEQYPSNKRQQRTRNDSSRDGSGVASETRSEPMTIFFRLPANHWRLCAVAGGCWSAEAIVTRRTQKVPAVGAISPGFALASKTESNGNLNEISSTAQGVQSQRRQPSCYLAVSVHLCFGIEQLFTTY